MPWKQTCAVQQRNAFVHDVLAGIAGKAELCRRYGISRPTGDKWLDRFEDLGVRGLVDRCSAPHRHPNEVPLELVAMIVNLRRQRATWGPRKLRAYLQRHYERVKWPAASTIGQILRRHELSGVRKRCHRTPPYTQPFAGYDRPNAVWCADFKGWFATGDGDCCHPLTISDGFSRYLVRCQAMDTQRGPGVRKVFESAFRQYGLPGAIRTDNGSPLASRTVGGLSQLSIWWLKLGIVPERIEPGKPQQNGRHERMHLMLKQETASPAEGTLRRQQRRFDTFRGEYNRQRPHEALGQRPPAELYEPSSRRYPSKLPEVEYPEASEVRIVQTTGTISWRKRMFYLSQTLARERVGLEPVSEGIWLIRFCPLAIGVLDERDRKIWHLEQAARRGLVDRDVLGSPFRYAPGTPQDGNM